MPSYIQQLYGQVFFVSASVARMSSIFQNTAMRKTLSTVALRGY
jgi:hypothetical protein